MTKHAQTTVDVAVLIVAAGRGQRFGGSLPKQYASLAGQPVLRHAISRFLDHERVDLVVTVIHPDDRPLYDLATEGLVLPPPVPGGETRQASVLNGLQALAAEAPRLVLVHDGARPMVSRDLIDRAIAALDHSPCVLPVLPVADTLKRVLDGRVVDTVDREGLFGAQTPQGFAFETLLSAHEAAAQANIPVTDDAMIVEWAGGCVTTFAGDADNFKITTAEDLKRMEKLMIGPSEIRVGTGFDAHRLVSGDQVMLCGVALPCAYSLLGHSDADVALHAVTDALLGALAEEDIGYHFPPKDEKWRGCGSDVFVRFARDRVAARGGQITHVDLTIICEAPRISGHRLQMREKLAEILDIDSSRVSVKGTTTEGMGFTGRSEGIAVQANVTISLPV